LLETHDLNLIYKAIGVQAIAFATYLTFSGVYAGFPSLSISGIQGLISSSSTMTGIGLLLAGLVYAFAGSILFKVKEKYSKVSASLFIIAGILAFLVGIAVLARVGARYNAYSFALGLAVALNTMAMPVLGVTLLKTLPSEDKVITYSTALYIATPIFTVYGFLGFSLAGLVATTLIYVESQGLPKQAEKLAETMSKVVPEE
jgi:hypothetical membrane protein